MKSLFSDNPTIQFHLLQYGTKDTSINKIYDSIEYLVTLRHDWINNLPVDLFMAPMVLNGMYHSFYNIVTIDLISVFKEYTAVLMKK